ncbi:hypothetical protein CDAR_431081 [Caerostris darwini]|uniref:Uncharacterized protein n=1 Tax=Caerostris darwini TaxID=1538125 RepID=A0AAV4SIY0_9ARAC|nr:hypothetical protein CDAR_431081 [Caerostris darwini]
MHCFDQFRNLYAMLVNRIFEEFQFKKKNNNSKFLSSVCLYVDTFHHYTIIFMSDNNAHSSDIQCTKCVPSHFNVHSLPGRDSRPHPVMNRNLADPCDSSAGRCAKFLSTFQHAESACPVDPIHNLPAD